MSRERIGCGKPLKTVMPLQCTLSACNATVKMSEGVGYERPRMRATFQAIYDYGLSCGNAKQKRYWLRMAAEEGHVQAMYLLSQQCDADERRRWLRMAAEEGHVPAMCELALACSDLKEKRRWLEEAARNGWQAAMMELAEICDCEGHISHGSRMHVVETTRTEAACVLDGEREEGFALQAARVLGIQGFHATHDPGSRGDFLQALHQLGAEPKIHRLPTRLAMHVHVSCSQEHWTEIFGEPECVEEVVVPWGKHALHRWKHFCSDGPITCIGHLFERSPGVCWVVVVRIALL